MDNDGDHSTRASRAECLLTKVKVSLAVAIIKTKPPGVSGREFAEALACRLRRQDENWKEKSEELQQEVLRLRQEVLINRLTGNTSAIPVYALDHTYCSDPDEGSETPELLLPDPQHATLLSSHLATRFPHPSSLLLHLPPPPYMPPSGPHGETDLPQVHFLQALLSLQRLNDPLCFGADGGVLLVDSVCRLLVSVVRLCRDAPPLGPGESVLQACHVSARSMEMFCSHRLPDEEFRSRVEAALRDLTEMLLHKKGLHRLQTSEKLMECLITLGKAACPNPFSSVILSQISALADRLWQSFKQTQFLKDMLVLSVNSVSCVASGVY
ncbi:meiosis-specific protein MEI4 isoform X2 [Trematomus bernacchii]|uniref:meiosis-specific protein MEI4 isoform X2 n=1 Tax=Trematomus bernacchii TaxID=40690 RepID=UPI00146D5E9F|nr:meiosis-specific protein MEI4 isoform X2 [Trematomus bernacchii]